MTNPKEEPILDIARGDIGMSRHLRQALKIIADSGVDKGLEKQLREIANGNGSVRDLQSNESFLRMTDPVIADAQQELATQTPEERQRLAERGNAILEGYRQHDPNIPKPTEPPAAARPPAPDPAPNPTSAQTGPVSGPSAATDPAAPGNPASQPPRNRRESWRDVVVTPDEPDEDDLYFQERRQRGWLQ